MELYKILHVDLSDLSVFSFIVGNKLYVVFLKSPSHARHRGRASNLVAATFNLTFLKYEVIFLCCDV